MFGGPGGNCWLLHYIYNKKKIICIVLDVLEDVLKRFDYFCFSLDQCPFSLWIE
jgi:hypothetical protein